MSDKKMLSRERTALWNQAVLDAHTAEAIQPGSNMRISAALLIEMDSYLEKLNEDILNGLTVFGCRDSQHDHVETGDHAIKANETMRRPQNCGYCGHPVVGSYSQSIHGTFHSHCFEAAQRNRKR